MSPIDRTTVLLALALVLAAGEAREERYYCDRVGRPVGVVCADLSSLTFSHDLNGSMLAAAAAAIAATHAGGGPRGRDDRYGRFSNSLPSVTEEEK